MKTYINGHCIEQILTNVMYLTQSEYDNLSQYDKTHGSYIITDAPDAIINASDIIYDNTTSGLTADDVQEAIDEIKGSIPTNVSELTNDSGYITTDNTRVLKSGDTMTGNLNIVASNSGTTNVDSAIWIGNNIPDGQTGCSSSLIVAYARSQYYSAIYPDPGLTDNRTLTLPNKNGTVAVTSEVEENVYRYTGMLLNASPNVSSNIEGYGVATISLRNGIAKIDFFVRITQNSDTTEVFNYGINRDLFKSAIGNIEVTPVEKGVFTFYDSNGSLHTGLTGYGGSPENINRDSQFWGISIMHNTAGTIGGWPTVQLPVHTRIVGTIYGTY